MTLFTIRNFFFIFVLDASVFLSIFWIKVLCFLLFCCHVIMHAKLFIPLIRVFAILYKNNTTIHWIKTLETVSRLRIFLQQFWSISDVTWALISKYYEYIKIIFSDKESMFGYLNLIRFLKNKLLHHGTNIHLMHHLFLEWWLIFDDIN